MTRGARPDRVRIAVGQMDAAVGELDVNLERIEELAGEAVAEEADVLVLPELALSGYSVGQRFHRHALRLDDERFQRLVALSGKIGLIAGFIEETPDALFFNSAAYMEGGRIRHLHRKIYPPTYDIFEERRYFGAGVELEAFDTEVGRAGMLICGDAWHISLAYLLAHDGADILFILAAASDQSLGEDISSREAWLRIGQTYGLTLTTFVVFANRAGREGDLEFWGGSFAVGPDGGLIDQACWQGEELLVVDLDMRQLRERRILLPFRRDDTLALTNRLGREILQGKLRRRDHYIDDLLGGDDET